MSDTYFRLFENENSEKIEEKVKKIFERQKYRSY